MTSTSPATPRVLSFAALFAAVAMATPVTAEPATADKATADATGEHPPRALVELLRSAEEVNVEHRLTVEQHRRASAEARQAWMALLPSLSVQARWTHNQYEAQIPAGTFGPDPITLTPQNQLDVAARIDLPLIDTGKWIRASAARSSARAAEARVALTLDQLRRGVITGWYAYAAALAVRQASNRSFRVAEAQRDLQEVRFANGTVPEIDLLRAQAEVERNRQTIADATRLVELTRRSLSTLSGLDPGDDAHLPPVSLEPPANLETLEARVDQLPVIAAARHDVDGAEKMASASRLSLVPTVNAQGTEQASNATSFNGQSTTYALGVVLSWRIDAPLFAGMDVQSSSAELASLLLEKIRLQAKDQIHADWQSLKAAIIRVDSATAQVGAAQKACEFARTRYSLGAATQIEQIQAERDLFVAEVQKIQAESDLASARVSLQLSAGIPIDEATL
ncbi:MAG: TolC family protein [Deltaproteobacteria bacterium]|nr:TolC family protein [Deltaproteobacteria bacterium]